MKREIVVFERDERHTDSGVPELDFRLIRGALPSGSVPLAMAVKDGFTAIDGQEFSKEDVYAFAEQQSGYRRGKD